MHDSPLRIIRINHWFVSYDGVKNNDKNREYEDCLFIEALDLEKDIKSDERTDDGAENIKLHQARNYSYKLTPIHIAPRRNRSREKSGYSHNFKNDYRDKQQNAYPHPANHAGRAHATERRKCRHHPAEPEKRQKAGKHKNDRNDNQIRGYFYDYIFYVGG